jgi:hypothetical protein
MIDDLARSSRYGIDKTDDKAADLLYLGIHRSYEPKLSVVTNTSRIFRPPANSLRRTSKRGHFQDDR